MNLGGTVSCVFEIGLAFVWQETIEHGTDAFPSRLDCPLGGLPQEVFELGKDLFDRVEIGAIGREKEEPCADSPDRGADGLAFVAAEIVENDYIAWFQRRDENLFDIEQERLAVDRTIDDPRRIDPVVTQGGKEGHRLPMAIRGLGLEPFSAQTPAAQWRHVRLDPSLIDEDEPPRIDLPLIGFPARPLAGDVRPVLLAWQNGFF